jgi:hypothetical protein
MTTLETWWNPALQCYRVRDGELFTYYERDQVVGHFINRDLPTTALIRSIPRKLQAGRKTTALIEALKSAGITVMEEPQ